MPCGTKFLQVFICAIFAGFLHDPPKKVPAKLLFAEIYSSIKIIYKHRLLNNGVNLLNDRKMASPILYEPYASRNKQATVMRTEQRPVLK